MLPLHLMVTKAATKDCAGIGITEKKEPMEAPNATESRQGFQSWRLNNGFVSTCHHGL
jgi:hypothetical protein